MDGEAGIGKSTLWSTALADASGDGDRILSWRASIAERQIAFAGLSGLLDGSDPRRLLDPIAEPRRRALLAAFGLIEAGREPPEPGLIGLAVADVLRALARDGSVLVAIDDLQWLDPATDDALAFAARRLPDAPVAFLVARRNPAASEEPGIGRARGDRPTAVAGLAAAPERRHHIELGPLSVGALGRLLHERLGSAFPRPIVVRLHEASSGNPFLALEIGRSIRSRPAALSPGEPFPVPPETGALVRDHLSTVSRDARRSLLIVTMSAEPSLDLVERVLGSGAAAAVDEAVAAGVLVAEGRRLRAAHPLYASIALADAPPGELRALHAGLADAADDPVERAIHLSASADSNRTGAAEALADAARIARGRGAPGVAAGLFERAANLDADTPRHSAILLEAAESAMAAGDAERAEVTLRAALQVVPGGAPRARTLLALGDIVYVQRPHEALELLVEALDHTNGDPVLEALVHAHIAGMADMDPARGYTSAMAAVDLLAGHEGRAEPDQVACALLDRAFHWLLAGERLALDDIDRGLALMRSTGNSFVSRRSQEVAERCLFHLGRLRESIALDEAEYRRLTDSGQVGLLPALLPSLSVLQLMAGEWVAARRSASECADLVDQGEQSWIDRAVMARARILAFDGELAGARALATQAAIKQEASGDRWEGAIFRALLGFIELSVPDPRAALQHLLTALDHADAMAVVLPTQFRFLGDLVEAAVLAGELDLAERIVADRLEAPATRIPLPWIRAMAARGRGFLAAADGRRDEAVAWFDLAIDIFEVEMPMPFERARTMLARGQVQRRADRRRAARDDLEGAGAVFGTLGAAAWSRRAADEAARVGGRRSAGGALTASERRVAELAVAGRSNLEIAAELVVSVRTVESQLSAVYRKLDIRSRALLRDALAASGDGASS